MPQEKIYVGSGKTQSSQYGDFYKVSICLSDLPAEHITKAKNWKEYINLTVNKNREIDQYGKDLSVQVDTWKPDPSNKEQAHTPKKEYADSKVLDDIGDLPF